jgi:hypothetical protein
MKDFDNPYFTKLCKNCSYRSWRLGGWRCELSGFYCSTERKFSSSCGKNYEKWKPNKRAFKEIKNLKEKYPQYFI